MIHQLLKLFKNSLNRKIYDIENDIKAIIKNETCEKFWVIHYGATEIDPKYLVYWICVKSDNEKQRLLGNIELNRKLRLLLEKFDYPELARKQVHIGFESQETVDRESNGNWYHHFK